MAKSDLTITLDEKDYQKLTSLLNGMSKIDQDKAIQYALNQGMQVIVAAGKTNLSTRNKVVTGNLKRSFALRVNKKKAYALGGFKRSAPKKGIEGGNHAHLVDRGTNKRWTKTGAYRGSVSKGNPNTGSGFWTDAVNSQGPAALNKLMDAVYDALEEIIKRNS